MENRRYDVEFIPIHTQSSDIQIAEQFPPCSSHADSLFSFLHPHFVMTIFFAAAVAALALYHLWSHFFPLILSVGDGQPHQQHRPRCRVCCRCSRTFLCTATLRRIAWYAEVKDWASWTFPTFGFNNNSHPLKMTESSKRQQRGELLTEPEALLQSKGMLCIAHTFALNQVLSAHTVDVLSGICALCDYWLYSLNERYRTEIFALSTHSDDLALPQRELTIRRRQLFFGFVLLSSFRLRTSCANATATANNQEWLSGYYIRSQVCQAGRKKRTEKIKRWW